jgi:hypothetical protein
MRGDDFAPHASRVPNSGPPIPNFEFRAPEALIPVSSFEQPGDLSPFIKVVQVRAVRQGERGRILEVWKERTPDDMVHHTAPRGHKGIPGSRPRSRPAVNQHHTSERRQKTTHEPH